MTLERYQAKRNFKATPEPRGRVQAKSARALSFVIQKHAASHLHYDFRLELDGVLLSWAIPKGPSFDPAEKRLAMHVEDHPLEYGGFEGIIPKGQYGGGVVLVWDQGSWQPIGDPHEGYEKGHLKFELAGRKLHGRWALVRTGSRRYGGKGDPWLLIKDSDAFARRGVDARIVDSEPDSVASGRSIEEVAAAADREWQSDHSVADNVAAGAIVPRKAAMPPGARRGALPAKMAAMLATPVKAPPPGEEWIHEVKYDGYRMLSRLDAGRCTMVSRNGKDWTAQFKAIAREVEKLAATSAWLDGEVCAIDDQGRASFQRLQNMLSHGASGTNLTYFVFDLMHLDGTDLRRVELAERKRLLQHLVAASATALRYSPEVRGSGGDVFQAACRAGLEGVVSKRIDSTYCEGLRTRSWLKIKCVKRQEVVIGGYTEPKGSRSGFGALLLGVYDRGDLRYAGKVGTGFDEKTLKTLFARLTDLEQKTAPFVDPPRGFEARGAHWVKPMLVAEVQFTEWSDAGALRHPAFIGLREDKPAAEVVREEALPVQAVEPVKAPAKAAKAAPGKPNEVAGVKLSHPDKLLFPEVPLSKLDLARYYQAVAEWILPHVKDRPLSLLRCPDGWAKECFYQKHAVRAVHADVRRVEVPEGDGKATYFSAGSLTALVGLLQWGVIELHPWGSRMPRPEKPDRLIFDFDPADDVPWQQLTAAVQSLRTLLTQLGLAGFLKTTGGKGLHVVVPIRATLSWPQAKAFTKGVADLFANAFPAQFVATLTLAKRKGRIFIDYLRNAEGATAIAPYGIRARKGAPVSTPIGWDELDSDIRFDHFNVSNVPERLRRLKQDPWGDFMSARQTVTAAMFKQVGASN